MMVITDTHIKPITISDHALVVIAVTPKKSHIILGEQYILQKDKEKSLIRTKKINN